MVVVNSFCTEKEGIARALLQFEGWFVQGVQRPGKPGEPGNVREFGNGPERSGNFFRILSCRLSISYS